MLNTSKIKIPFNPIFSYSELFFPYSHSFISNYCNYICVSTGAPVITLVDNDKIKFVDGSASGKIALTDGVLEVLNNNFCKNTPLNLYVNIHSTDQPAGLIRGQVGINIANAYNIPLTTEEQFVQSPVQNRPESGNAIFRLVGQQLFYKITVENLIASDRILNGHIHKGAKGNTGNIIINLLSNDGDLNITKSVILDSEEIRFLNNDLSYVNVHSEDARRGQIR